MKANAKTWIILAVAVIGILTFLDARVNATASPTPEGTLTFTVSDPVTPVLSVAVRDIVSRKPEAILSRETNPIQWMGEGVGESGTPIGRDPLAANSVNGGQSPLPLVTFEGVPSLSGVTPPDTNGDVGPNHYVQMTNFHFQIWDKGDPTNGIPPTPLISPIPAGDLFSNLGGQCTNDFGDPVVLYDDLADRWLLSQFGLNGPLAMCIAISTTPDPTGTYYLYEIPVPDFPDYPKLGVWPDAYYMGTNTGYPNSYYVHAFDRVSMLAGLPASIQSFGGLANLMMPADVDGPVAPPVGDPGIFYTFYHPAGQGHPAGSERLAVYEFDVDWATPANSTYTLAEELPLAPFNYTVCGFFAGGCVEQPGTNQLLDDLSWWPMFRFQYRNFGGYAAMVGNFTVDPDNTNRAAIRWFEIRKTGSGYSLYQEGTYDPDTDSRWMGSIAMDISGDIALGYSVSSSTTIPSIRYAVRQAGDPLGTLASEAEMWAGGGVQTGIHRWGDYSDLTVDPVDGCTFWFTTEYHDTNDTGFSWNTRIGVFRLPACGGPTGTMTGQVTDSSNSQPIPDVAIHATASITKTGFASTDTTGAYNMTLLEGTYTVTASVYGYFPDTVTGAEIISGTITTQDFQLDPAPIYTVDGAVTDANTGWPLYAKIQITGYPGAPVWTDPLTGQYSIDLAGGIPYTFKVTSWTGGYQNETRTVGPFFSNTTEDFTLAPDLSACTALGYMPDFVYLANFENNDGGFTVDGSNATWAWGHPSNGPGGAHSGQNAWATNLSGDYNDDENSTLTSPDIDLSAHSDQMVIVSWWQWLQTESSFDYAWVEVSNDGGSSWQTIFGPVDGFVDTSWAKHIVYLDPSFAVSDFKIRFTLSTDFSVTYPGFYVDDVGIGVATPPPNLYAEDFEANDGSYIVSGTTSWEWGFPTRGPSGAHSGDNVWATALDNNYGNNEDGYVTSPVIDLSGGAGETLVLSWWQWLQTENNYDFASVEVTNNGISWTQVYSTSGVISSTPLSPLGGGGGSGWNNPFIELDPSYATSVFQVRFHLTSDGSVNYPGFYIDDVNIDIFVPGPPNVSCELQAGGLVAGRVFDDNTSTTLNGATVTSVTGLAYTQPTPDDPAMDDGFYILFASTGTQPITATMTGYGVDIQSPNVPLNGAVWQDFNLPAGWLAADPGSVSITLDLGQTGSTTFDLNNQGSLDADFLLREKNGDFTPAIVFPVEVPGYQPLAGAQPTSYATSQGLTPTASQPFSYTPPATARFSSDSATVLLVEAGSASQIQAMLLSYPDIAVVDDFDASSGTPTLETIQAYDTVIVISNFGFADPVGLGDVLADYVDAGGTVVQTVPTFYDPFGIGWGLQGRFMDEGYSPFVGTGDWFSYAELGDFDPNHLIMEGVTYASDSLRQVMELTPKAELVASWTDDEFVAVKDNVVALNTFISDGYDWSGDIPLIVHNTIIYLQSAGDVPWLSTDPITGTVTAQGTTAITVNFDANVPEVPQPGDYTASLLVKTNTPYDAAEVLVTMTINPPNGWGKVTGFVTGLGYCDAIGGPLSNAEVEISGVATTQSNELGSYTYWMAAGTYDVTVSASGYVSQTFTVTITNGGTNTQNVDLRWDGPCTSASVNELNVTVIQGTTNNSTLTLDNAGAGNLFYNYFESLDGFSQVTAPALSAAPTRIVSVDEVSGPASVRTFATLTAPSGIDAPLSGWFSAVDHPEGVIRYASAQCYEQPDSYYVMSGLDGTFSFSTSLWRFDATSNSWTQLADIPAGHEAPVATCYQGRIYLMGGDGTDEMYIYDINQDTWFVGASLPRLVEGAAAAAWNGQIFLFGGDDDFYPGSGVSDEVNIYDIATDTWASIGSSMPAAASNAGFVQVGQYLFVVGGWGLNAPDQNNSTTQRYNLASDTWELGPAFDSARADFSLAATNGKLYALGGDEDGGEFFEGVTTVEHLDLSSWPLTAWSDLNDPLPIALQANNGGFCTMGLFTPTTAEIWSVGGLDTNFFAITGRTLVQERLGESCYSIYTDVDWLSVDISSGVVPGDTQANLVVTVDATNLDLGTYSSTIVIVTNDMANPQFVIPVSMIVGETATYSIYLPIVAQNP